MHPDTRDLCIFGTGGFGREVLLVYIDMMNQAGGEHSRNAVFMVDDADFKDSEVMGLPVIKRSEFDVSRYAVVIGVGDPATRKKIVDQLPPNTVYTSLIHPTAVISEFVTLGKGAVVTAGVIVTCNIVIGEHAHLNLHTTVGHDCVIGDYFTTAPGAKISGICNFGECVYFGTNSCIRQGVNICDNVTIGMGGVVVKDISEPGVYVGSPAKKLVRS